MVIESVWLVVEPTHLKNICQSGNLPQIGIKIFKKYVKPPPRCMLYFTLRETKISHPWEFGENHGLESAGDCRGYVIVVSGGSTFENWAVTSSMILVGGSKPHEKIVVKLDHFPR